MHFGAPPVGEIGRSTSLQVMQSWQLEQRASDRTNFSSGESTTFHGRCLESRCTPRIRQPSRRLAARWLLGLSGSGDPPLPLSPSSQRAARRRDGCLMRGVHRDSRHRPWNVVLSPEEKLVLSDARCSNCQLCITWSDVDRPISPTGGAPKCMYSICPPTDQTDPLPPTLKKRLPKEPPDDQPKARDSNGEQQHTDPHRLPAADAVRCRQHRPPAIEEQRCGACKNRQGLQGSDDRHFR